MTDVAISARDYLNPSRDVDISSFNDVAIVIDGQTIRVSFKDGKLNINGDRPLLIELRVSNDFNVSFAS